MKCVTLFLGNKNISKIKFRYVTEQNDEVKEMLHSRSFLEMGTLKPYKDVQSYEVY